MRRLAAAVLGAWAAAAAASPFDAIDRLVDGWQASRAFSGAIVVLQDGATRYERAAGWADPARGLPYAVTTPTDGASLAKPFTGLLVLMLAREGRLDLDAPAARYAAEYPHGDTRVRDLLAHAAGLPDYDAFDALFRHGTPVTTSAMLRDLGERRVAPQFAPGTRFDYCNVCYNALAVVAERVTGARYEALLRERVWRPAGMADAYVRPAKLDALPPGRAVGHRWRDGRDEPRDAEDNEDFHGGSNVYASARGFARFAAALADDAPWLGPAAADAVEPVRLADGATTGITLGGWFCAPGGRRCYFNGHHQGFFSVMYWDRARRLAVAWVSNSTMPLSLRNVLTRGLVAAAEGRPVAVSPVQAVPLDAAKLAALAGDHEVGGIGRVRVAIDGKRGTLRTAGVDYELFRVSPAAYYAPGVDALLGATADGRLTWSSVFVQAVGTPVR